MPDPSPTRTSGPVRYWRVRSITTRQATTGEQRAGEPEGDRERRDQHQQQPDGRRDRDQDLVGDPRVGADPHRVDVVGVGGDVGGANSWSTLVPVAPSASHGNTLPASTTTASAVVSTTAGSNVGRPHHQPGGQEDRAHHDRREQQGAALAQADQRETSPATQRPAAGRRHRQPEEVGRPAGPASGPATAAYTRAHPGHRDRGLGLALGAREHDRRRRPAPTATTAAATPASGAVLDQQRDARRGRISRPAAHRAVRRPDAGVPRARGRARRRRSSPRPRRRRPAARASSTPAVTVSRPPSSTPWMVEAGVGGELHGRRR